MHAADYIRMKDFQEGSTPSTRLTVTHTPYREARTRTLVQRVSSLEFQLFDARLRPPLAQRSLKRQNEKARPSWTIHRVNHVVQRPNQRTYDSSNSSLRLWHWLLTLESGVEILDLEFGSQPRPRRWRAKKNLWITDNTTAAESSQTALPVEGVSSS